MEPRSPCHCSSGLFQRGQCETGGRTHTDRCIRHPPCPRPHPAGPQAWSCHSFQWWWLLCQVLWWDFANTVWKTFILPLCVFHNLKTVLRSPTLHSDLHTTYQKQMPFQSFIECVCLIRTFYLIYPKILKSKTSPMEILIMQRWIWAYFCPFFNVCKSFCKTLHFYNNVPFCRCWCVLSDLLPCVFTQWAVGR